MRRSLEALFPDDAGSAASTDQKQAVFDRLGRVTDPELDESVTAMGFVEDVTIDGAAVTIDFRLPTFWCSANFAFLMAEDMRIAVEALPWVRQVTIRLNDHFAADRINQGVARKLPFEQVFAGEATKGLADLRATFRQKAFLGRQSALLDRLIDRDGTKATLSLSIAGLAALIRDTDEKVALMASRYLAARRHDGGTTFDGDPAFTTLEGQALTAIDLPAYRRMARGVLSASRANAEMCRMYAEARANGTDLETLERRRERQAS